MSRFFIDRPVFAIVLAILITMLGTIAGFTLPIAQYPNITKPQVSVETTYVGANSSTVEEAVATAIEQKVNGVENMVDMRSTSTNNGGYTLNVYFNLDKNGDIAAVEVQNRVDQASSSLPSEVTSYGVTTAKKNSQAIMYFALSSPNKTYDSMFLKAYAMTNFLDAIKRVKGVSEVDSYGPEYAMRLWLHPDKMAQLGITASEVSTAIKAQNVQAPVGAIGSRPTAAEQEFQYSASAQGRLTTEEQFGNIIITSSNGQNLKLKDIATIKEGPRSDTIVSYLDGGGTVVFPVYLTTDANALDSVAKINAELAEASKRFPPDMKITTLQDNTVFVRESLTKVAHTFGEALLLVMFVVYLFMGNWRATAIPLLAVPVSLVGTFGAFVFMGFSINTVSMFAMILAIGLVVDDAIVVVEAVEHHIQDTGLSPREATYRAMREVSGPVVAIAFILAAVFIPIAFTGGTTGMLYKQFSLTIAVSMALSAVIALTLTPALCALLLKPRDEENAQKGFLGKIVYKFNQWFARLLSKYVVNVEKCIRHMKVMLIGLAVMVVLIGLIAKNLPSGYVPDEDQGNFIVSCNLPEAASSNRGIYAMEKVAEKLRKLPGVAHVSAVSGIDILTQAPKSSAGLLIVSMKPYNERNATIQETIQKTRMITSQVPEMTMMAFNSPALPGVSTTGSLNMYIMNLAGDSVDVMNTYAKQFVAKANQRPEIGVAYTTFNTDTPAYNFDVDRDKAESLGVPVSSVYTALQTFLGGSEINDFNRLGRTCKVVMQADAEFRKNVHDMRFFYVKCSAGDMVPLDTLVKYQSVSSVPTVTRFNGVSAFKIAGSP
ncbi:MAG: efflux RND transporter permease subunit, partial [Acidaminococcaceae bacterium]|nr:efflux RND transporter permease subunit [Acidaminococcaceae bacterium]